MYPVTCTTVVRWAAIILEVKAETQLGCQIQYGLVTKQKMTTRKHMSAALRL